MDKETRNAIERATRRARKLLEDDFAAQLEGTFDVLRTGKVATVPGSHLTPRQRFHRDKIVAAIDHKRAAGMTGAEAVADYLRDAAFTTLNRFVALKMLEARDQVQECITKGEQSAGYREFCGMAPGLALLPESAGYRLYIESLFDELSTEVKVLFDRRDTASVLWPKRAAFDSLLDTLNPPDLAGVWAEDETIGWVYENYNCADVSMMREAANGGPPRNSHELAVRNQFFTPRYVVEFLTDNTLGRIWYEMTRGKTDILNQCLFLVRQSTEIDNQIGACAPNNSVGSEASIEHNPAPKELQQSHATHHPLKDPREIRLLDPACGSMHFGLYAFDLFTIIYDEAWEIAHSPDQNAKSSEAFEPFVTFTRTFIDKAAFLRVVPSLIIELNIHGIDIDPRATQIAGFALWLRAQRAWRQLGVKHAERPRIIRSNIVCAEPMPGEKDMLSEFIDQQFPEGERSIFSFLLSKVFDRMTLAGELGFLLRIEDEIRAAINEARAIVESQSKPQQLALFRHEDLPVTVEFDLRDVNDEQFWNAVEQRIYHALEIYANQAGNGAVFQRRMFSADAAKGFAFVDLCRQRYDVLLMNPPFGEPSVTSEAYVKERYKHYSSNILCAFLERHATILTNFGRCGCVLDRSILIKNSDEAFRRNVLLEASVLDIVADLGWHVLNANVEVSSLVLAPPTHATKIAIGYDVTTATDKATALLVQLPEPTELTLEALGERPFAVINFQLPKYLNHALRKFPSISSVGIIFYNGHTIKSDVFKRLIWEVSVTDLGSSISRMWNGSEYAPFYVSQQECVIRDRYAGGLNNHRSTIVRSPSKHYLAGLCFGKRGEYLDVQILPSGFILTNEGFGGPASDDIDTWFVLALLNSLPAQCALNFYCGQHKGVGYVNALPCAGFTNLYRKQIKGLAQEAYNNRRSAAQVSEVDPFFLNPFHPFGSPTQTSDTWFSTYRSASEELGSTLKSIDDLFLELFEVDDIEREGLFRIAKNRPSVSALSGLNHNSQRAVKEYWARSVISYSLGCNFGRWDIRYTTGERSATQLPDPFAALPACPPGMLQGVDGLPISTEEELRSQTDSQYPLDVAWDGILIDDSEHPLDLQRRTNSALTLIWGDHVDNFENEVCALLQVPSLGEWFRRPDGFFSDHLKRYSKSRRKAPIYWPLSTSSGRYSVWLYYNRLSKDTLYKVLEHVKRKVLLEEDTLARLSSEAGANLSASQRKEIASQEQFVIDLRAFQEELEQVAPLWSPNLNDGVIINLAPLWRMVDHKPWQKTVRAAWDELVAGQNDWTYLAMHLWPERVVPKCATDRSLAIAHDLEAVFWEKGVDGKWKPRAEPTKPIAGLIRERTSPAVKTALKSLLQAPTPAGSSPDRSRRRQ